VIEWINYLIGKEKGNAVYYEEASMVPGILLLVCGKK